MIFHKVSGLRGKVRIPGDKSISHRAVMFGSIARGDTHITGFLTGADCLSTIGCFHAMGVGIEQDGGNVVVHGRGMHGLHEPAADLDCGNSGTTMRLISGILAPQPFDCILTGDASIQKRPMKRIMEPLGMMGASIESIRGDGCAPLRILGAARQGADGPTVNALPASQGIDCHGKAGDHPGPMDSLAPYTLAPMLHGIHYISPVASAQVKSCVLLAGLYADSPTSVTEPSLSRNHTELMLAAFGARLESGASTATIYPADELYATHIDVPGDISSAAFFLGAGLIVPGSEILLENVGVNPTRDGVLRVFLAMGADIEVIPRQGSHPSFAGGGPHAKIPGTKPGDSPMAGPAVTDAGAARIGDGAAGIYGGAADTSGGPSPGESAGCAAVGGSGVGGPGEGIPALEPSADILVRHSELRGVVIEGGIIPTLIDELPLIAGVACFAEGTTIIRDAAELKVKESNRIAVMVEGLRAMGADVLETDDGMVIHGRGRASRTTAGTCAPAAAQTLAGAAATHTSAPIEPGCVHHEHAPAVAISGGHTPAPIMPERVHPLHGATVHSLGDHRIAMTFAVLGLAAEGETHVLGAECVDISYPGFFEDLKSLLP